MQFVRNDQLLCRPNSVSFPFSPEERFERNILMNQEADNEGNIGESEKGDSLEIRSIMIDIARNFHSVHTIKAGNFLM